MSHRKVLIVIDTQNDFCPDGALGVAGGNEIVPGVNALMNDFEHVVLTQDWHPADHLSFASQHPGAPLFSTSMMPYGPQTLWPDHCVIGSSGAAFHQDLTVNRAELILRKGFRRAVDSYSAFFENDHRTPTGLGGYLKERGLTDITLVGLAFDYCVRYSAEDARYLGFSVRVIQHLTRSIDLNGSVAATRQSFSDRGVVLA